MDLKAINELVGTTFRSFLPANYDVKFDGKYTMTRVNRDKVVDLGLFTVYKTGKKEKGTVQFLYDTVTTNILVTHTGGKKIKSAVDQTISILKNDGEFAEVSVVTECGQ